MPLSPGHSPIEEEAKVAETETRIGYIDSLVHGLAMASPEKIEEFRELVGLDQAEAEEIAEAIKL